MAMILVIDDELELLDNVMELLEYEGHRLITARDGEDGVGLARQYLPNLIISDLIMPHLDGIGVLTVPKSDPATATIPVILISAYGEREMIYRSRQRGVINFLVKPFMAGDLLSTVSICLNGKA
jgi:CheY-like chemotaxis protein